MNVKRPKKITNKMANKNSGKPISVPKTEIFPAGSKKNTSPKRGRRAIKER
jgi:hypothetical protein